MRPVLGGGERASARGAGLGTFPSPGRLLLCPAVDPGARRLVVQSQPLGAPLLPLLLGRHALVTLGRLLLLPPLGLLALLLGGLLGLAGVGGGSAEIFVIVVTVVNSQVSLHSTGQILHRATRAILLLDLRIAVRTDVVLVVGLVVLLLRHRPSLQLAPKRHVARLRHALPRYVEPPPHRLVLCDLLEPSVFGRVRLEDDLAIVVACCRSDVPPADPLGRQQVQCFPPPRAHVVVPSARSE
mmetsp:Transcript_28139/g.64030  ORF Transcript_28139/g.64030 Transcript_28139/m.64030 type:complete len:241 (-) Transcript_28139:812-1534(-)